MTRPCCLILSLLFLPLVTIGCGDSESDGYREITAAVESLPTTAEIDEAPDNEATADATASDTETLGNGALRTEVTPDESPNAEPVDTPAKSGNAVTTDNSGDAGTAEPQPGSPAPAPDKTAPVAENETDPADSADAPAAPDQPSTETASGEKPQREIKLLIPTKKFRVEGPDEAVRVSFDDVDLLKVLNMDPVIPKAPELMPDWLKELDGKRVRIRGFMIPPFSETDVRAFTLARDTQLCCFGRNPLPYDLIDVFLKEGAATEYIELRPFDVVGVFHIGEEIEPGYLYSIDDAVVIQ